MLRRRVSIFLSKSFFALRTSLKSLFYLSFHCLVLHVQNCYPSPGFCGADAGGATVGAGCIASKTCVKNMDYCGSSLLPSQTSLLARIAVCTKISASTEDLIKHSPEPLTLFFVSCFSKQLLLRSCVVRCGPYAVINLRQMLNIKAPSMLLAEEFPCGVGKRPSHIEQTSRYCHNFLDGTS